MPLGMICQEAWKPLGLGAPPTLWTVGAKPDRDRATEDRIRAWVRERMEARGLGVTAAAKLLEHNQGNLTRILLGTRGVSAGLAYRISMALTVPLEHLFHSNPPETFWRYYVPRPAPPGPGGASPSRSQPTRQRRAGGGEAAREAATQRSAGTER